MEPGAAGIDLVHERPLPLGRRGHRPVVDGRDLHDAARERPRPPQAAPLHRLDLEFADPLVGGQRELEVDRSESDRTQRGSGR